MHFPWQAFATDPQFRNRIALRITQGESFTWQQLAQKINAVALQLEKQGVQVGDEAPLALCGKNSLEILLLYCASLQLGVKVLPLNPAFPSKKIQQICQQLGVKFYYSATALCLPELCGLRFDFSYIAEQVRWISADFHQPATLTLTSGSSGEPKAVVHHVQAHLDNAHGVCALMAFSSEHCWLLSLPLYHVSGQGIVWRWLSKGATLQLVGEDFALAASCCSHLSLVPTQAQRLLDLWQNKAPQGLQHILLGGSEIPVELTQKLTALGIQSYVGYGMTEMASTIFAKKADGKLGVGQALRGREYRLVNGEIWLRGAGLALGYWQNQQVHSLLNKAGWFASGDKGALNDGELQLLGRLDNMFISGGENIQPEEIERLLLQHPQVKQVVVLPKQDREFGYRPVAIIEFFLPFSEQLVAELRFWLANKIEKFKQPVAYYQLQGEHSWQQGQIKLSRQTLKQGFNSLLGKNE